MSSARREGKGLHTQLLRPHARKLGRGPRTPGTNGRSAKKWRLSFSQHINVSTSILALPCSPPPPPFLPFPTPFPGAPVGLPGVWERAGLAAVPERGFGRPGLPQVRADGAGDGPLFLQEVGPEADEAGRRDHRSHPRGGLHGGGGG